MPRVKRGNVRTTKRKRVLVQTKGFMWGRKKLIKLAKTASTKAGSYSYRDRRVKKRVVRRQWQVNINAAVREHDLTYSKFIASLKKNNIDIDRKILAELAINNPEAFKIIIAKVK